MIVPFDFKCSAKNQQVTHQQSFRMRGRWTEHIKRLYIFFFIKSKRCLYFLYIRFRRWKTRC